MMGESGDLRWEKFGKIKKKGCRAAACLNDKPDERRQRRREAAAETKIRNHTEEKPTQNRSNFTSIDLAGLALKQTSVSHGLYIHNTCSTVRRFD